MIQQQIDAALGQSDQDEDEIEEKDVQQEEKKVEPKVD
jgi:hypothetical protein